jgi:hypothetical protein
VSVVKVSGKTAQDASSASTEFTVAAVLDQFLQPARAETVGAGGEGEAALVTEPF